MARHPRHRATVSVLALVILTTLMASIGVHHSASIAWAAPAAKEVAAARTLGTTLLGRGHNAALDVPTTGGVSRTPCHAGVRQVCCTQRRPGPPERSPRRGRPALPSRASSAHCSCRTARAPQRVKDGGHTHMRGHRTRASEATRWRHSSSPTPTSAARAGYRFDVTTHLPSSPARGIRGPRCSGGPWPVDATV